MKVLLGILSIIVIQNAFAQELPKEHSQPKTYHDIVKELSTVKTYNDYNEAFFFLGTKKRSIFISQDSAFSNKQLKQYTLFSKSGEVIYDSLVNSKNIAVTKLYSKDSLRIYTTFRNGLIENIDTFIVEHGLVLQHNKSGEIHYYTYDLNRRLILEHTVSKAFIEERTIEYTCGNIEVHYKLQSNFKNDYKESRSTYIFEHGYLTMFQMFSAKYIYEKNKRKHPVILRDTIIQNTSFDDTHTKMLSTTYDGYELKFKEGKEYAYYNDSLIYIKSATRKPNIEIRLTFQPHITGIVQKETIAFMNNQVISYQQNNYKDNSWFIYTFDEKQRFYSAYINKLNPQTKNLEFESRYYSYENY